MSEKITVSFEIDPSTLKDGGTWCSPIRNFQFPGWELVNLNAAALIKKLPPVKTPTKFDGGIEAEFFPTKCNINYDIIALVKIEGEVYGVHGTYLQHESVDGFNDSLKFRGYSRKERREIFKRWFNPSPNGSKEPKVFETSVGEFKLKFEEVYYSEDFIKNLPKPLTHGKLIPGRRGVRLTVTDPWLETVRYYSICNPFDTFSFRKGIETALATTSDKYVINDGWHMRFTKPGIENFKSVMQVYDNFVKNGGGSK